MFVEYMKVLPLYSWGMLERCLRSETSRNTRGHMMISDRFLCVPKRNRNFGKSATNLKLLAFPWHLTKLNMFVYYLTFRTATEFAETIILSHNCQSHFIDNVKIERLI